MQADLSLGGAVRIGTDVVTACNTSAGGALRYNAGIIEFCNGQTGVWQWIIGGVPAGAATHVQLNNKGASPSALAAFGADPDLTWDATNNRMGMSLRGVAATHDISLGGNANRTIGVERRTATGVAWPLLLYAGDAHNGDSDTAGGSLILSSGISTGTGASSIIFMAPVTSGGGDNIPKEFARLSGEGLRVVGGAIGADSVLTAPGTDSTMFFYTRKAAFRAGKPGSGLQWDDANIGNSSVAGNLNTIASGDYSAAWGDWAKASGVRSTAFGGDGDPAISGTLASGTYSTAFGTGCSTTNCPPSGRPQTASGQASTVFSSSNFVSCTNCTVWGGNNQAITGAQATAWGDTTIASGTNATAWGLYTLASGQASTAWGTNNQAVGDYSTAFGRNVRVGTLATNGVRSVAIGLNWGGTPTVTGNGTLAIFAADQTGVTVSANNTMGLFGIEAFIIDPRQYPAGAQTIWREAELDAGQGTDALLVPIGTSAQRPTAYAGMIRYCTSGCAAVGFEVYEQGAWLAMGDNGVSDRRIKQDIAPLDGRDMLDRLAQVKTYSFHKKDDIKRLRYGVIAQQLETVFPSLVYTPAVPNEMKTVFYTDLIAPLIAAVKDLKKENDDLTARIAALKDRPAWDASAGPPPPSFCTTDKQRGRLKIDTTQNRLYICNGAKRGWDYISLKPSGQS